MYDRVILLVGIAADEVLLKSIVEHIETQHGLKTEILLFSRYSAPVEASLYLLYLSDENIRDLFARVTSSSMNVGILSNERCPYAIRSFGISRDTFEAIDDALNGAEATPVDLLKCNGMPVLGSIVIGDVHGMNREGNIRKGIFKKIAAFFSDLVHLSFQGYTITTAKGNITTTAATGILIFEHNISGVSQNIMQEDFSLHDGMLQAFILAPSSIVSYLYYLFLSEFINKIFSKKLPKCIGLISSSRLDITSPQPISYISTGESLSDNMLTLEVVSDAVRIHLGRNIRDIPAKNANEKKEIIRMHELPQAEKASMLANESIPFFSVASEEDFKELFIALRESSRVSSVFIILMVLSTLLTTTGLFQNSTPVIIGAMILAPLMAPIVSFSMGVVRGEKELLKESTTTLMVGIVTALAFSCLYTYLMPLNLLTEEMRGRLNPNILDLMVAILSGVAGAYAQAKSEIAKSLAGVAIAVALVPPLSVTGIGIGWWDMAIVYGSFLLFMTNLAGMTLAAALTFLILGYAPVKRATKGIVWTSMFLLIVTIPLFVSFFKVIEQNKISKQLKSVEHLTLNGREATIRTISVDLSREIPVIYIKVRSNSALQEEELQKIKLHINEVLERPVVLDVLSEIELK
ncbi:MAG: TIGR00341 family protein [Sulfurimonadaceae bacterium]